MCGVEGVHLYHITAILPGNLARNNDYDDDFVHKKEPYILSPSSLHVGLVVWSYSEEQDGCTLMLLSVPRETGNIWASEYFVRTLLLTILSKLGDTFLRPYFCNEDKNWTQSGNPLVTTAPCAAVATCVYMGISPTTSHPTSPLPKPKSPPQYNNTHLLRLPFCGSATSKQQQQHRRHQSQLLRNIQHQLRYQSTLPVTDLQLRAVKDK